MARLTSRRAARRVRMADLPSAVRSLQQEERLKAPVNRSRVCAHLRFDEVAGDSRAALSPPGWHSIESTAGVQRLRTLWRVQATSGRIWECVSYHGEMGEELRLQPEGKYDAAVMTQVVRGAEREVYSESWRTTLIAKGFTPLGIQSTTALR